MSSRRRDCENEELDGAAKDGRRNAGTVTMIVAKRPRAVCALVVCRLAQDAQELFQMLMQLVSEEAVPKLPIEEEDEAGASLPRGLRRFQQTDGMLGCHGLLDEVSRL